MTKSPASSENPQFLALIQHQDSEFLQEISDKIGELGLNFMQVLLYILPKNIMSLLEIAFEHPWIQLQEAPSKTLIVCEENKVKLVVLCEREFYFMAQLSKKNSQKDRSDPKKSIFSA